MVIRGQTIESAVRVLLDRLLVDDNIPLRYYGKVDSWRRAHYMVNPQVAAYVIDNGLVNKTQSLSADWDDYIIDRANALTWIRAKYPADIDTLESWGPKRKKSKR